MLGPAWQHRGVYARIALRNLWRQPVRTAVAGLAVAVAVAALVFADAWARGIGAAIREYAASSRLGAVQLHAPGYLDNPEAFPLDRTLALDDEVRRQLAALPGARGVAGRIRFGATGSNGTDETMVLGLAIEPEQESRACPLFLTSDLERGRTLRADDTETAIVGSGLARSLSLDPGEVLTLQARDARGRENAVDVQVVGVASSSLPDEAKWLVIVPLGTAQQLLGLEGRVTSVVLGGAVEETDALAARARAARPELDVRTWRELGVYFEQAVKTFAFAQRFLMGVLASLVLLVIVNIAVVSTSERAREIGTLTALGASAGVIRGLFLLESASFGAMAALLGALLGFAGSAAAAAKGIPFTPPNQPTVLVHPAADASFGGVAVVGATFLCMLGTFLPAVVAARLPPSSALKP